jgi:hypothetical protein
MLRLAALAAGLGLLAAARADDPPRFDYSVREDIFRGLRGDKDALARGLKGCEDVLAKDPKHAEALVWHGSGLMFQAGDLFRSGDQKAGVRKWTQAIGEMDGAVKLEPNSRGTRVPRGVVYVNVAPFAPKPQQKELAAKAKEDLEYVLGTYKGDLSGLSDHRRGELLLALAQVGRLTGDEPAAQKYLDQLIAVSPDSKWGKEAAAWKKDPKKMTRNCVGCHTGE